MAGRDARFDGAFFFAVETTGIYCRPSCPAVTPKRKNVRFYPTAAAARGSGFRACRRCIRMRGLGDPDVAPDVTQDPARHMAPHVAGDGEPDRSAWRPWRSYAAWHLKVWAGQTVSSSPQL